jgi:hypothetical protein
VPPEFDTNLIKNEDSLNISASDSIADTMTKFIRNSSAHPNQSKEQKQAKNAFDNSKTKYKHQLIDMDQHMYKIGRRMDFNKYQKSHQEWLDKYNEKKNRSRVNLYRKNARKFKNFQL